MLIDNRYLVEEELGRGGMGVVFKCRDQVLYKFVALKLLQSMFDVETQAVGEAQEARFVQLANQR
jgi:Protein kinase domain.